MIVFPSTLTPVPRSPGYFWDVKSHKLYSIKVGGVLRELKRKTLWSGVAHYYPRRHTNAQYYSLSVNGRHRALFVEDLKKLELVDYDMPVINRVEKVKDENFA